MKASRMPETRTASCATCGAQIEVPRFPFADGENGPSVHDLEDDVHSCDSCWASAMEAEYDRLTSGGAL